MDDLIRCPICEGATGHIDHWGEWSECDCCNRDGTNDTGKLTRAQFDKWQADMKAIDDEIERQMSAPCDKCGIRGGHLVVAGREAISAVIEFVK